MNRDVIILVGTMTGTAELTAEAMGADLRQAGLKARVLRMEHATVATFDEPALFVICVSSCGKGAIPLNSRALFAELESQRPDLAHVRYAVFALGDLRDHGETFCFGGRKFDELLAGLGATAFAERGQHDMYGGVTPQDQAREWLAGWTIAAKVA